MNKTLDITCMTNKEGSERQGKFHFLILSPSHLIYYALSRYLKLLPVSSITMMVYRGDSRRKVWTQSSFKFGGLTTLTSESEGIVNNNNDDSDEEEPRIQESVHSARRRRYVITVFKLLVLFADHFSRS